MRKGQFECYFFRKFTYSDTRFRRKKTGSLQLISINKDKNNSMPLWEGMIPGKGCKKHR